MMLGTVNQTRTHTAGARGARILLAEVAGVSALVDVLDRVQTVDYSRA